jgi:hypothetical protein
MMTCPYKQPAYRPQVYTIHEVREALLHEYHLGIEQGCRVTEHNHRIKERQK